MTLDKYIGLENREYQNGNTISISIIEEIVMMLNEIAVKPAYRIEKEELIMKIYIRSRRAKRPIKIETISRYLRHLVRKGLLERQYLNGSVYYIIKKYSVREFLYSRLKK